MRKRFTRIVLIIVSVIVFGGAIYLYNSGAFGEKNPEPKESASARPASMPGARVTPVEAMLIQSGSVRDVIYVNGSTVPNEEVTVSSEVPGKVTKILFKEGSFTKKGAPLVQLDVTELKAQKERLLVQQQLTRKIAERLEGLYNREGVSLQEYEIARAEADQIDAELALIDVQIEKRTVKAPFEGLLGLRQVSEGSYLSPGTAIVSLVNINPINIEFSVPERYGRDVNRGTRIDFRLDGSNDAYTAVVVAKEPNVDPTTRTLKLKAEAANPSGRILPGAFANVSVNLQFFDDAIMVPTQSIIPELGGKKVFVLRDGKAQSVAVETGIRREEEIQVLKGLQQGDTLIITGILQVKEGTPVEVTKIR